MDDEQKNASTEKDIPKLVSTWAQGPDAWWKEISNEYRQWKIDSNEYQQWKKENTTKRITKTERGSILKPLVKWGLITGLSAGLLLTDVWYTSKQLKRFHVDYETFNTYAAVVVPRIRNIEDEAMRTYLTGNKIGAHQLIDAARTYCSEQKNGLRTRCLEDIADCERRLR